MANSRIRNLLEYYRMLSIVEDNPEYFSVGYEFSNSYTENSYLSGNKIDTVMVYESDLKNVLLQKSTYTYDLSGNVDTISLAISGGTLITESYTYDLSGNVNTITKTTSG